MRFAILLAIDPLAIAETPTSVGPSGLSDAIFVTAGWGVPCPPCGSLRGEEYFGATLGEPLNAAQWTQVGRADALFSHVRELEIGPFRAHQAATLNECGEITGLSTVIYVETDNSSTVDKLLVTRRSLDGAPASPVNMLPLNRHAGYHTMLIESFLMPLLGVNRLEWHDPLGMEALLRNRTTGSVARLSIGYYLIPPDPVLGQSLGKTYGITAHLTDRTCSKGRP